MLGAEVGLGPDPITQDRRRCSRGLGLRPGYAAPHGDPAPRPLPELRFSGAELGVCWECVLEASPLLPVHRCTDTRMHVGRHNLHDNIPRARGGLQ